MKEKEKTEKAGGAGFPACAGKDELCISRRRLPHWQLPGSTYFITSKNSTAWKGCTTKSNVYA
jgi:hypothetical protein